MINYLVKQAMSSVITGEATAPNTIANSVDAAAVLESHRPDDYALVGQGNANFDGGFVPAGAVAGSEQVHPLAPKAPGGASTNSVIEVSKNASVQHALRKLAEGSSTITGGMSVPNNQAASPSAEGHLDISQRPEDYALVGQGNANFDGTPAAAVTGMEVPHPDQPAHGGAATNSVVDASKNAQWNQHFNAVANLVGPRLPQNMPMEAKVAAVKQCMALEPYDQNVYLQKVASQYSPQSTVGSLLGSLNQLHR
jgi:hypothetical protein